MRVFELIEKLQQCNPLAVVEFEQIEHAFTDDGYEEYNYDYSEVTSVVDTVEKVELS